ncbi:unnamed protein product [Caenorhabditis sp. 36 PRJEB53466]|nr:unnamed protein product [Caenorhabditis sp. 36 PRJEB53466]
MIAFTNRALLYLVLLLVSTVLADYGPELRVHKGALHMQDPGIIPHQYITSYEIGSVYTFEVFLDETTQHDYMVQQCTMNGAVIIGSFGCVECGNCISQSVETESYNKPGAIKRTLITFVAKSSTISFDCDIEKIDCSGCAERSCQRRDQIALAHYNHYGVKLMYPPPGYATGVGVPSFPIPIPNIYPTPPFGGYNVPPHAPPMVPPVVPPGGSSASSYGSGAGFWPWWIWLLILLLLLLLLCCLLALCFAAFMKRRKERHTAAATTVVVGNTGKDCGVGTEKVSVTCVGTDTQDIVKVQPAVILAAADLEREQHQHQHQHHQNQYSRSLAEYDQGSVIAGGSYSLREGMVHEAYTRTLPRESQSTNSDRYTTRDRFERQASHDNTRFTDRSSYRNFAYERDMGRVEPMDGFDEVETRERTYCLSDDDQEVVEKNIKRTHTTRYVTETRDIEQDNEERVRGDEYHHAPYTHSLPV